MSEAGGRWARGLVDLGNLILCCVQGTHEDTEAGESTNGMCSHLYFHKPSLREEAGLPQWDGRWWKPGLVLALGVPGQQIFREIHRGVVGRDDRGRACPTE